MAQKEPIRKFVLHDRHGNEIDFSSFSVVSGVSVTFHAGVGEPYCESRYQGGVLYLDFYNLNGEGITGITYDASEEDGGTNYIHISTDGENEYTFPIKNGSRGNGITSIETVESQEDDGYNVVRIHCTDDESEEGTEFRIKNGKRGNGIASVTEEMSGQDGGINTHTITDTDGQTHTIHTRNGRTGRPGADRQPVESGDVIIAHDLGADEEKVMSQKGVTDAFVNANSFAWKPADYTKKSDLDISDEGEVSTLGYRYLYCVQVSAGDVVQMNGTGPTTGEDPKVVVALFDGLPENGDTAVKVLAVSNTVDGEYSGVFSAAADGYLVMRLWGTTSNVTAFKAQSVKEALTDLKAKVDYIGDMEVTGWESQEVEKLSGFKISSSGIVSSYRYRYIFYAQVEKGDIVKVLGSNQADEPIIVALFDGVPADGSSATAVLDNSPAVDGEYENSFRIASNGYCAISMYGTNTVGKIQKATKIQDLVKMVKGESIEPTYTTTSGKYITKNGGIGSSSAFSYTSPIEVRAGDKVTFSSDCGTSGLCSCIALTDAQGTTYRSQMAEKGFAKRSYDVMEDGYVALSYITATGLTIVINRGSMVAAVERMQSVADTLMVDSRDGTITPSDNPLARLISGPSRVRTFKSYGIIGASFETGYTNANLNGEAIAFYDEGYEWPTLMGKVNGVEVYNYALAGHAFKQWLRDRNIAPDFQATNLPWNADTHQPECFIINMSSNDLDNAKNPALPGDPAELDPTINYYEKPYSLDNPFTWDVAAIIQLCRVKSPQCYIFVATVRGGAGTDARAAELIEALKTIAAKFDKCYVLDIRQYGMDWSKSGYLSGSNTSHPTRLGHVYLADQFNTYIDWYIGKYPELFKDAAYIGTDYQLP